MSYAYWPRLGAKSGSRRAADLGGRLLGIASSLNLPTGARGYRDERRQDGNVSYRLLELESHGRSSDFPGLDEPRAAGLSRDRIVVFRLGRSRPVGCGCNRGSSSRFDHSTRPQTDAEKPGRCDGSQRALRVRLPVVTATPRAKIAVLPARADGLCSARRLRAGRAARALALDRRALAPSPVRARQPGNQWTNSPKKPCRSVSKRRCGAPTSTTR